MICLQCKSNIADDARFCPVCGYSIKKEVFSPSSAESKENSMKTPEAETEQKIPVPETASSQPSSMGTPQTAAESVSPENTAKRWERSEEPAAQRTAAASQSPLNGRRPQGNPSVPPQKPAGRSMGQQTPMSRRRPMSEKEFYHIRRNLSTKAMVAFILSIFGIFSISMDLPCAIVGLIFSIMVKNEYRDRNLPKDKDLKLADIAFICSIIGLVLGVIMFFVLCFVGVSIGAVLSAFSSLTSYGY